jgi:ribosomal protein S18 acetylase RimI-like enzyme
VGVDELAYLPFVRHAVDPDRVLGAWRLDGAAAVVARRPMAREVLVTLTGFGPAPDQARLLAALTAELPAPDRLTVAAPVDVVPEPWRLLAVRHWHWMLSSTPAVGDAPDAEEVEDPDEVDALLDAAAPDSHARPGTPGVEVWLGLRDGSSLVAVGAVVRQPDGSGHLRAVTVAPHARGRGLGRALSVALTRRAMSGPGIVSLGVYADNEPALRIYRGLGYEVAHSFSSGPVSGSSSTTAVAPSR